MADPYHPALDAFKLSPVEVAAIDAAMQTNNPWDWIPGGQQKAALRSAKEKILAYHLQRHGNCCCYCRTNLSGAGPFMTDREHILPKSKYKDYVYSIWNLAASCKRCNMQFKKDCDAFVVDKADAVALQQGENYRLVHPNFDLWETHLTRLSAQANTRTIVRYLRAEGSSKAGYTHDYFSLHELEVDSFDQAQGRPVQGSVSELAVAIRKLAKDFGQ